MDQALTCANFFFVEELALQGVPAGQWLSHAGLRCTLPYATAEEARLGEALVASDSLRPLFMGQLRSAAENQLAKDLFAILWQGRAPFAEALQAAGSLPNNFSHKLSSRFLRSDPPSPAYAIQLIEHPLVGQQVMRAAITAGKLGVCGAKSVLLTVTHLSRCSGDDPLHLKMAAQCLNAASQMSDSDERLQSIEQLLRTISQSGTDKLGLRDQLV
ncbi:MAG: hypothetical protein EOO40_00775 [Deltaproteobacteria bacterium]|nr:MAG: hypothetical protein EOO40_00775 [Deltaproteobacteria bacterium]